MNVTLMILIIGWSCCPLIAGRLIKTCWMDEFNTEGIIPRQQDVTDRLVLHRLAYYAANY